jgi:hypothetical protein
MRFKAVTLILTLATFVVSATAQTKAPQLPVEEVIKRFAQAESENKIARTQYAFTQDVDIMTIGQADSITGRYRRTSEIILDDRGNRIEKITFFPVSTLTEVSISQEDLQDLAGVQPFALTAEDLPKYTINFIGKEKADELNTYVFEVKPKQFVKGERYFQGRIWVDDEDLQIVKAAGQAVPEVGEQKFPRFETYRENIDGRYWFPTYVYADDVLDFKKGPSVHLRMVVRYTNYKKFGGTVRIGEGGSEADEEDLKGAEKEKKPEQAKPTTTKPPEKTKPPEDQ